MIIEYQRIIKSVEQDKREEFSIKTKVARENDVKAVYIITVKLLLPMCTRRRWCKVEEYDGTFNVNIRQRGSHARGVLPIQECAVESTRMKHEEEADTKIIAKEE